MKIVLLGPESSGKTTYVAAMYAAMADGKKQFGLQADDPDMHDHLCRLAEGIGKGDYPLPTDRRSEYDFTFSKVTRKRRVLRDAEHLPVLDMTLVDHRGGALDDGTTEQDVREMIEDLEGADGLVVFVDAPTLLASRDVRGPLSTLAYMMQGATEISDEPMPVIVLLTKADVFGDVPGEILDGLQPILDALRANGQIDAALMSAAVNRKRLLRVEQPLLFAALTGLRAKIEEAQDYAGRLERRARREESESTFWHEVASIFKSDESHLDTAKRLRDDAAAQSREVSALRPVAEELAATVRKFAGDSI